MEAHKDTALLQETRKTSNNLIHHLKELEKEQAKHNICRKKETIKIREELKQRFKKQKVDKTKNWFFERANNIDKPLAIITKKKKEKTQIRNERG